MRWETLLATQWLQAGNTRLSGDDNYLPFRTYEAKRKQLPTTQIISHNYLIEKYNKTSIGNITSHTKYCCDTKKKDKIKYLVFQGCQELFPTKT